jgi:hypothetical protein
MALQARRPDCIHQAVRSVNERNMYDLGKKASTVLKDIGIGLNMRPAACDFTVVRVSSAQSASDRGVHRVRLPWGP